jgi:hypothetical protein
MFVNYTGSLYSHLFFFTMSEPDSPSSLGYGDNDDNDDIIQLCLPSPHNRFWKSNFAIFISSITEKNLDNCLPTNKSKEIYDYVLNKKTRNQLSPKTRNDLSTAYSIWSSLKDKEKDEFENYLEGSVPVNPDDFDKDPDDDNVVKQQCDEFYRQIISAFKTWSAENQVEEHFKELDEQRKYDNITREIINSLRDTRPDSLSTPEENRLKLAHINPTLKYDPYIPIPIPISRGGSRKYIRRRFKKSKSKSKSKKSKPKSKSKFNRKSKSKTKRRQK